MNNSQKPVAFLSVSNDLSTDQRLAKICQTFLKAGYQVRVIGRKLPQSLPFSPKDYQATRMNLIWTKGPLFYAELNFRLFFILMFKRYDVLYANDLDTLPANYLASLFRRKKIIYDSHEYFTEVPELQSRKRVKACWTLIEKSILPHLKDAFTVCDSIAEAYHQKYGLKMKVMRNVPALNLYKDNKAYQPENKIIIYQGSLNMGRGLEKLFQAMKHLPEAQLWIFGGGDLEDELRLKANECRLCKQITFFGKLPFESLREYTRQASLGVSMEENIGLNYYYALPNKLFDYMQAGVPVLVSPFPEMKKLVEHYQIGTTCDSSTPEELADHLRDILSNREQLLTWHENCEKASQELIWEEEEKPLLDLLRQRFE